MSLRINRPLFGWLIYDFANSAFATTVLAVIFNQYFAKVVAGGEEGIPFSVMGIPLRMHGAALWSFLVALSTAIVALSAPLLGAIADFAGLRRRMLVICCCIGVVGTMALSGVGEGDIVAASLIFILANFGFAGGNVFYNAFILDVSNRETFGRVSGLAWGLGYLGGGLCLALNLLMLSRPQMLGFPEGYFDAGDCIIVAGAWWGVFALPTMLWLKDRRVPESRVNPLSQLKIGWRRIRNTLGHLRRYKQLARFLAAYLLFNDGIETVIVMASIFGAEVIGMNAGELVGYFIMVQGAALVGSFIFGWLADRIGNRRTLLITLGVWLVVVIWAYKVGWLMGLRQDYYMLGLLAGSVLGGSQAAARSMQAAFTPPAKAGEFFGFFSFSGKFASIFGPLVYGAAILIGGDLQTGILALGAFFIAGGALLWFVDEGEGSAEALKSEY